MALRFAMGNPGRQRLVKLAWDNDDRVDCRSRGIDSRIGSMGK
jgi:hypothetical protein